MSFREKALHEVKAIALTASYFGAWIGFLIVLKSLVLAEYGIEFSGLAVAAAGALVLSKVVLILELVPLGSRVEQAPAWVDVVLRTALYSSGLVLVLLAEKLVHALRHEPGGWEGAIDSLVDGADYHHVAATTLCLTAALLVYNASSVVRRHLPPGGYAAVVRSPVPRASEPSEDEAAD